MSREVEYRRKALAAYREGRYLESSQWSRLAEYERDRATVQQPPITEGG